MTISAAELLERLTCDPNSGSLTWLKCSHRYLIGQKAGSVNRYGYLSIEISRKRYLAHRIVWLIAHGEWPTGFIDHINGNRLDNRISNLRLATVSQNGANAAKRKDNKTGFKGVSQRGNSFRATIGLSGRQSYLGTFHSAELAHAAYVKAAREHYGEFARTA